MYLHVEGLLIPKGCLTYYPDIDSSINNFHAPASSKVLGVFHGFPGSNWYAAPSLSLAAETYRVTSQSCFKPTQQDTRIKDESFAQDQCKMQAGDVSIDIFHKHWVSVGPGVSLYPALLLAATDMPVCCNQIGVCASFSVIGISHSQKWPALKMIQHPGGSLMTHLWPFSCGIHAPC